MTAASLPPPRKNPLLVTRLPLLPLTAADRDQADRLLADIRH